MEKLLSKHLDMENAELDGFGGIIPIKCSKLKREIGCGKLYICIHIGECYDDTDIFLTSRIALDEDEIEELDPMHNYFEKDEKEMILNTVSEYLF